MRYHETTSDFTSTTPKRIPGRIRDELAGSAVFSQTRHLSLCREWLRWERMECRHHRPQSISGNTRNVMISPPAKMPMSAITDASWKVASPITPWPDVQPPAYEEPNPTRKPPPMIEIDPRSVSKARQLNSCAGTSPEGEASPSAAIASRVRGDTAGVAPPPSIVTASTAPTRMPAASAMFQLPDFFQS